MAVLGMRGTGTWSADERPGNWREKLLQLFPNSPAIMTALVSKLANESVDDPKFSWFEMGLPIMRLYNNGGSTAVATTITVESAAADVASLTPASVVRKGMVMMNERTFEVFWVVADPVSPFTTITVERGKGSTAATMNNDDGLLIIGTAHQEGEVLPVAIQHSPTTQFNYAQIFRTSGSITRTAKKTRYRTGDAVKELKRQCLEMHGIQMEFAFLFGARTEDLAGAQPKRTTGGLRHYVSTNLKDFNSAVTIDAWDDYMELMFKYGSSEKLCLCGSSVLNTLNKMCRDKYTITATPTTDTYGMKMEEWVTPYGTLFLKQHPLLTQNPVFTTWGFIIDAKNLRYRYVDDTEWKVSKESSSETLVDAQNSEFLTECGLEIWHEKTHGIFSEAGVFVP